MRVFVVAVAVAACSSAPPRPPASIGNVAPDEAPAEDPAAASADEPAEGGDSSDPGLPEDVPCGTMPSAAMWFAPPPPHVGQIADYYDDKLVYTLRGKRIERTCHRTKWTREVRACVDASADPAALAACRAR